MCETSAMYCVSTDDDTKSKTPKLMSSTDSLDSSFFFSFLASSLTRAADNSATAGTFLQTETATPPVDNVWLQIVGVPVQLFLKAVALYYQKIKIVLKN